MDLKQYRYILKIAELKNLTRAAQELYVSQPSLSHYVARVEAELGAPIFDRNTSPLSLTAAGEKYVETAKMILQLDSRLRSEVADLADGKRGRVTVGISHARASFFLPYVLPEFRENYPGVDIRTVEVRSDLIEEQVSRGQCDLGILPLPVSGKYEFDQEVICKEELVLVSGQPLKEERHATDGRAWVELSDCAGYPFSLLKKGHGIRTAVDVLFMERGIRPSRVFETTSNETAYRLSTAKMGLSIVPESTIMLSNPVDKPFLYSLSPEGLYWEIGAICRKREYLTGAAKSLIGLLRARFSLAV